MMPSVLSTPLLVRILLALVLAAAVYFFAGFIVPVLAALILGFATWPLYVRLVKACHGSTIWAATIALFIVTVGVVAPLSLATYYAVGEASSFIRWFLIANREGITAPTWINALPLIGENLAGYWNDYLSSPHAISNMTEMISGQHIGNIYRAVLSTTGGLFSGALFILFSLMTLFFVYKDGYHLASQLDVIGEKILVDRWQHFSRVVPATISSTVTGMGLIAIGEGVILGVAYWVAGVPSPVLLGLITAVMAMIPGGAPLSFTLVSIYLVGSGDAVAGIALFLWGTLELFIVDKTLRPRLVGGPVKLPFLPTFFGLVGGVQTMGFVGLFIGPVLMALIVAIWREWVLTLQTNAVNLKSDQTQSFRQPK
jgi:predicted PurR-regulated permease PerM